MSAGKLRWTGPGRPVRLARNKMAGDVGNFFRGHEHDAGFGHVPKHVHDIDAERGTFLGGAFAESGQGHLRRDEHDRDGVAVGAGDPR
jgi:hypothetical protein